MNTDKLTTEQRLRRYGCSNHGCLIQELPKGSMGTNAMCSCYRRRTELDLQNIFQLKAHQKGELLDTLRAEKEASEMVMDSCLKAEAALKRANDMINDSYQCECGNPKTPCPCLEGFLDNIQAILDKAGV